MVPGGHYVADISFMMMGNALRDALDETIDRCVKAIL
jgi:hypothetical protein